MAKGPTVRLIASQTGVSVATVSRVLNNRQGISSKARDTVLKAMNDAGFRMRGVNGGTIQVGLVYTRSDNAIMRGYDADLASGVYQSLSAQQAQLAITDLGQKRPDETYTQFFMRKHIDGVVLRLAEPHHHLIAGQITKEGFPCVVASERFDDPDISFVDYDSRIGTARAMDYLAQLGHRRIALVIQQLHDTDHADRLQAYRDGMERHGLDNDPALILPITSTPQGGASAMDQLLALPAPPTAVMFTNPPPTIGAIKRVLQRGLRIPQDLSIIGYDNSELRYSVFPSFSAVCQDAAHIGQLAASAVMRRVMDRTLPPLREVIPTLFEVNETTGPRPASDSSAAL